MPVQDLDVERRQHFGLGLQVIGDLGYLGNGGRRDHARGAGAWGVCTCYDDVVAQVFYCVAGAGGRFGIVLVDDAGLVQSPCPGTVIRAYRIAFDRVIARPDLLSFGCLPDALARLLSGGIARVDRAMARHLLFVSGNRIAMRDRT